MARPLTGQVLERKTRAGRTFALRFRAYGQRRYVTLGSAADGWSRRRAEEELENVLADVRRGIWQPPPPTPVVDTIEVAEEPTLHVLASEWVERRRHEVDERTVEHWRWALSTHLLRYFAHLTPSEITAARVERYKTAKLAEREKRLAEIARWQREDPAKRGRMPARPLGNASITRH